MSGTVTKPELAFQTGPPRVDVTLLRQRERVRPAARHLRHRPARDLHDELWLLTGTRVAVAERAAASVAQRVELTRARECERVVLAECHLRQLAIECPERL